VAATGGPTRLSLGAVCAGAGGIVLALSLFLDWISASGFGQSGWELFKFIDIVLFAIGLAAAGFAALEMTGRQVNLPFSRVKGLQVIGLIATTITVTFLIEGSNQGIGLILGTLAAIAIFAGGIIAERAPGRSVAFGGGAPAGGAAPGGYAQPPVGGGQPGYGQAPPAAGGYAQAPSPEPVGGAGAQATAARSVPPEPAPAAAPAGSPPPPPGGAADWYPDPHGQKRLRYWDGSQWTEHVAD
jgi:Protein of unknown function (DUF2510)